MTPAAWLNRLAIRQRRGLCQDSVKPCATMIARSFGPGRWTASIGTPSSVTRVVALTTDLVMLSLRIAVLTAKTRMGSVSDNHRSDVISPRQQGRRADLGPAPLH